MRMERDYHTAPVASSPKDASEGEADGAAVDLDTLLDAVITPDMSERLTALRKQVGGASMNPDEPTLRGLRLQAGISQRDLARRLNTNQAYISKLERGEFKDPSLSRAMELAEAFGVSLDTVGRAFNHLSRPE
jgi:DNA-binding XRE family transcriptional regulator